MFVKPTLMIIPKLMSSLNKQSEAIKREYVSEDVVEQSRVEELSTSMGLNQA